MALEQLANGLFLPAERDFMELSPAPSEGFNTLARPNGWDEMDSSAGALTRAKLQAPYGYTILEETWIRRRKLDGVLTHGVRLTAGAFEKAYGLPKGTSRHLEDSIKRKQRDLFSNPRLPRNGHAPVGKCRVYHADTDTWTLGS